MQKITLCLSSGFLLCVLVLLLFSVQSQRSQLSSDESLLPHAQRLDRTPAQDTAGTVSTLTRRPVQSQPTDASAPVLTHVAAQEFPDVDGQRVVWQDARFGPTDIFMKNMATGVVTNVTGTDTWEIFPDLDGDRVIWRDGYDGIGIHGVDLTTRAVFTVTSGHSDVSRPRLSGDVVVWASKRTGKDDWNVYGFNIATGTEFVISEADGDQKDPQVDGRYVVWWDDQEHIYLYDIDTQETVVVHDRRGARLPDVSVADHMVVWQDYRNGNWDIFGYDLDTQTEIPLVIAPAFQEFPALSDGLLTYQSQDAGNSWNIHLYPLALGRGFATTDDANLQIAPAVDGSLVVWTDNRNHQMDIYYFEWTGTEPAQNRYAMEAPTAFQVGAFPGGQIRLQWEEDVANEQGFIIERARGITGIDWEEVARVPANTTVYTDARGVLRESYWYRVKAYNANGVSKYTPDSFNSTFDAVYSPDEQHLMVLVNEARFDPGAFGYPDYAPVPPVAYNANIAYSARSHSQSVLNSDLQFGHCDPIGRCPGERAVAAGYPENWCSENLTTGTTGPEAMAAAHQGFMDSEGHRDGLMAAGALEFGVGHTYRANAETGAILGQMTEVFCSREGVKRPAVPMGSVIPYTGTADTVFTYAVNFYSAAGKAPAVSQVVIDGVPHEMDLSTGAPFQGTYRYTTTLDPRVDHRYYFRFEQEDGTIVRWPQIGEANFPNMYSSTGIDLVPSLHITTHLDSFEIEGDIYNAGASAAPNTVARLYLGHPEQDGELLYETSVGEIDAGEHKIISYTWFPPSADEYTFYLWVESGSESTESEPSQRIVLIETEIDWTNVYLPLVSKAQAAE